MCFPIIRSWITHSSWQLREELGLTSHLQLFFSCPVSTASPIQPIRMLAVLLCYWRSVWHVQLACKHCSYCHSYWSYHMLNVPVVLSQITCAVHWKHCNSQCSLLSLNNINFNFLYLVFKRQLIMHINVFSAIGQLFDSHSSIFAADKLLLC